MATSSCFRQKSGPMVFLILGSSSSSLVNFRGQLLLDLAHRGYEVHACAPELLRDKAALDWLVSNGIICHNAPYNRAGLNPFHDIRAFFQLKELFCKVKPQLFLAYTIKPVIWGTLAAAAAQVEMRVSLITGLGYAFTGTPSGKRRIIQFIARKLYATALKRSNIIFFQNNDDKNDFNRLKLLPKDVPVHIVNGSGVDVDKFPDTPLPPQPVSFLLIARMLGDKGIREFVDAARIVKKKYPHVKFHLVGGLDSNPDSLKQHEIEAWCHEGLIKWHGHQADVRPFIQSCHVFVLPSYREGTPRSVLEAMSMGRAIITTDAPGCRETVIDGDNGYRVLVKAVEPLALAMQKFIEDPELIEVMGRRSRTIAVEKYDVMKINQIMLTNILSLQKCEEE
ncbi:MULTISPECIES: glycosyltransferase family 4 protein [Idiomarina]|uniref:glycosyltransferase family 4 protein n=1 Tax=Idiomarina TaxID=135575 RepID=UPI00192E7340|nr:MULTISPECIES: glycosyltransferase family 4 protein [Idiomarina]UUN12731.1 glycosyltransferase family 4 protein [Idiomarina loihiensis]